METIYRCEVCGKEFEDGIKALAHEKTCKEKHATGLRLARELTSLLEQAAAANIKVVSRGQYDRVTVTEPKYDTKDKQIYVTLRVT